MGVRRETGQATAPASSGLGSDAQGLCDVTSSSFHQQCRGYVTRRQMTRLRALRGPGGSSPQMQGSQQPVWGTAHLQSSEERPFLLPGPDPRVGRV